MEWGGAARGQGWRCSETGHQLILVGAGGGYMRVHYTVLSVFTNFCNCPLKET